MSSRSIDTKSINTSLLCSRQDVILSGDTMRVLWAYHPNDPIGGKVSYHGHQNRGVRSLYLKEGPSLRIPEEDLPYMKFWDLRAKNTRLPNDDHTHYWCQIYKAPELSHKHHMIGVSVLAWVRSNLVRAISYGKSIV